MTPVIAFETVSLYAALLTSGDSGRFHEICTQPHILKWMDDWDMSLAQTSKLISFFIGAYGDSDPKTKPLIFKICDKTSDKFVGVCGFGPKDELNGDVEIAYFVDSRYVKLGYMTQVIPAAIKYFFDNFDCDYLCAMVDDKNVPSKKLITNNHFELFPVNREQNISKAHYRLYRKTL